MLCDHSPAGPAAPRRMLSRGRARRGAGEQDVARRVAGTGWPARRRCRSAAAAPGAWVQASVAVRVRAFASRCLSASSSKLRAIRRHAGPERDARRAARGYVQAITQREHRIEHGADGARQRASFEHARAARAVRGRARELRAIGFELGCAHGDAFDHGVMRSPDFRFIGRAAPAVGDQHALAREEFRAHEHLRECRVRHVRGLGRQHQLGIRR